MLTCTNLKIEQRVRETQRVTGLQTDDSCIVYKTFLHNKIGYKDALTYKMDNTCIFELVLTLWVAIDF